MDEAWDEVAALIELQSGVVSRRQVTAAGLRDHDIRRKLRRREWAVVHDGVYVDHTGQLSWLQRAWAVVLAVAPAALCQASAIRGIDGPGRADHDDSSPIHVAVDRDHAVRAPAGVVLHRLGGYDAKIHTNTSPPRQRIEEAVIDVAAEAPSGFEAIATLADAVRARRTTAARMRTALDSRSRIRRRTFLAGILDDIAQGTCSVLEQGYLDRVERAHGLPVAGRQVRASAKGVIYRDVDYEDFGLIVELDGRLHHTKVRDRDRDLDRDLDAAVEGRETVRIGWGQVFDRSCRTATSIGELLTQRGWPGTPTRCPECAEQDSGGSLAPGDCDPPLSA